MNPDLDKVAMQFVEDLFDGLAAFPSATLVLANDADLYGFKVAQAERLTDLMETWWRVAYADATIAALAAEFKP